MEKNNSAQPEEIEIVEIVSLEDESSVDFEALAACQGPTKGNK